jgi:hypothetical protein
MAMPTYDPNKLGAWLDAHNGMNGEEFLALEEEARLRMAGLERKAKNYSGNSRFASYTVYTERLMNEPGGP